MSLKIAVRHFCQLLIETYRVSLGVAIVRSIFQYQSERRCWTHTAPPAGQWETETIEA